MKKISLFTLFIAITCLGFSQPFNGFLDLDGVDDYIEDNFTGTNMPNGSFTVELWVFSCDAKGVRLIDAAGSTAGSGFEMGYYHGSGPMLQVKLRSVGSAPRTSYDIRPIGQDRWNHLAVTYNALDSTSCTFVNGVKRDSSASTFFTPAQSRFFIGRSDLSTTVVLKARIDELRISDTVRYTSNFTPPRSEFSVDNKTKALYHFNGTTVNILDATSNNYHLLGQTPDSKPVTSISETSGVVGILSATDSSVCVNRGTQLMLDTTSKLNDNKVWALYADSCAGNRITTLGAVTSVGPITKTTTFFVRAEDGCAFHGACDSITIIANPIPIVVANASDTVICKGDSLTLYGSGAATYRWRLRGIIDSATFVPTRSNSYRVIGTDSNGCENTLIGTTNTIRVTVRPVPAVSIADFNPDTICINSSALKLNSGIPVGGMYSGNGVTDSTFSPLNAGSGIHYVSYKYANQYGCGRVDSTSIVVQPEPMVLLSSFNPDTICDIAGPITLPVGSPAGGVYSGVGVSGSNFDPNTAGSGLSSVVYEYSSALGCSGKDSTTIFVGSTPVVSLDEFSEKNICNDGKPIALPSGLPVGGTYNGVGVSESNFDPSTATTGINTIVYKYTTVAGCQSSDSVSITVDICSGLESLDAIQKISIAPNPFSEKVTLRSSISEQVQLDIIDFNGRIVFATSVDAGVSEIDTESLEKGIYIFRITNSNSVNSRVLVK